MLHHIQNAYADLSSEKQYAIWQGLAQNPILLQFIADAIQELRQKYYDVPEPDSFDYAALSKHFTEKQNLKSQIVALEDLLEIDATMRKKVDTIETQ